MPARPHRPHKKQQRIAGASIRPYAGTLEPRSPPDVLPEARHDGARDKHRRRGQSDVSVDGDDGGGDHAGEVEERETTARRRRPPSRWWWTRWRWRVEAWSDVMVTRSIRCPFRTGLN